MILYDEKLPIQVQIIRPDMKYYLLLDRHLDGCRRGLKQANVYIAQSFMIHNKKFKDIFMRLGASQLSDMEVLSVLIHQMHGEDDRYYDESNDDTPAYEFILPCEEQKECCCHEDVTHDDQHHVNNDLTAAVLRDIRFEEQQVDLYEQLIQYVEDDGADRVFEYLKENAQKALDTLKNTLNILTTHTEMKDFGEGDTHNAWDLDTTNYFDKPNPIFINPNDVKFPIKKPE